MGPTTLALPRKAPAGHPRYVTLPGERKRDETAAERQARHREKTKILRSRLQDLREALEEACEHGRCSSLTDHLPDDPEEWLPLLTERIRDRKIIVCRRDR